MNEQKKILASACLAGVNCRYDGGNKMNNYVKKLVEKNKALPVCPEELGGLPTPREPSEIVGGDGKDVLEGRAKILSKTGNDVTEYFIRGAEKVLEIVKSNNISEAILKAKSPSCGCGKTYDGTFSDNLIDGDGVLASILIQYGLEVRTEEDL